MDAEHAEGRNHRLGTKHQKLQQQHCKGGCLSQISPSILAININERAVSFDDVAYSMRFSCAIAMIGAIAHCMGGTPAASHL